ncbi:GIY-YIG nuclease family protein [Legionella bononiensis]|uniref:GIY-YIG nuclease family protein n=1 Tax=Legionella bononiensis TaxID=2793102 RepID=A0ABS1WA67_9GAMM|nr:GIY-YIG nuclease family protein [Legionella bononiensis]MBL7480507.1 GIY-YIG nuclease family protein [Legionella bononiensis]MBL7526253.1 GIY-YIG nuclease family protein [Legionella bononiensis]MBL7563251.1 GIY-YIG nuclease family protein [Legionella bononiensis]
MSKKDYWVYILLCENQSYYTGYTDNLEKRFLSHLNGTGGCKYTRSFKPLHIAQCWIIDGDKPLAMKLERDIKKKSKQQKLELIQQPTSLSADPRVQPFKPIPFRNIPSSNNPV